MTITWSPAKTISCKETIQVSDNFGSKKDVSLVLKSVDLKKTSKKSGLISIPKRLKMKTPSPPSNLRRSMFSKKTVETRIVSEEIHEYMEYKEFQECHQIGERSVLAPKNYNCTSNIFEKETINYSTLDTMFDLKSPLKDKKSNPDPPTPSNASGIFDNFKFTPATETKTKSTSKLEYFASMPTPQASRREDFSRKNLMNVEISPEISPKHQIQPENSEFIQYEC